ncbi:RNA methyltransferase [Candidatus Nomurabacteria bacterium]|nr:RNA methyltransferase [Candidatus Nomurabacteria bacterium]
MLEKNLLKHIGKLAQKKYRRDFGHFIVEGEKGVMEALRHGQVAAVIISAILQDDEHYAELTRAAKQRGAEVHFASNLDINKIKTTETFSGVMALCEMPENDFDDIDQQSHILYLENISDPGNLGTLIRTADWFGVRNIVLSRNCVDPYNDKVVRSTMGSIFRLKLIQSSDDAHTLELLKKDGYVLSILDMNGDDISTISPQKRHILALGSESHGISPDLEKMADQRYTIPGQGSAESLNVAMAGGIALYQLMKNA